MSERDENPGTMSDQVTDMLEALCYVGVIIGTILMAIAFVKEFARWIQLL